MGKQQVTQVKRFQLRASMLSMMLVVCVLPHFMTSVRTRLRSGVTIAAVIATVACSGVLMRMRRRMVFVMVAVHAWLHQLPHSEYYQHNTRSGADAARLQATQQSA